MSYLKGVVGQAKIYICPLQQSLDTKGEDTVRQVWARLAYIIQVSVLKRHVRIVAVQPLLASSETTCSSVALTHQIKKHQGMHQTCRVSVHDISPDVHFLYRTEDTPSTPPSPPPQRIGENNYHCVDAQLAKQVNFAVVR